MWMISVAQSWRGQRGGVQGWWGGKQGEGVLGRGQGERRTIGGEQREEVVEGYWEEDRKRGGLIGGGQREECVGVLGV